MWSVLEAKKVETTGVEFNSYPVQDPEIYTSIISRNLAKFNDAFQMDFVDHRIHHDRKKLKSVYREHQSRIAELDIPLLSKTNLLGEHFRSNQRRFDFVLERGIVRELSSFEVEAIKQRTAEEKGKKQH